MGTALAAIFATVIEPGPYTPFNIVAAGALSLVLIGYYRTPAVQGKEALRKAAALGGIVALLANIGLAYFVQEFLLRIDYYPECRFSWDPPRPNASRTSLQLESCRSSQHCSSSSEWP
jgi:hypothetical protein